MELISKAEVFRILAESRDVEFDIDNLPMIFLGEELVCDTAIAWNKGYMAGIKERPKGKWIPLQGGMLTCSVCGKPRCEEKLSYCYGCGAEMEIEE